MPQRITQSQLESAIALLNRLTDSPLEPYTRVNGQLVANVGNYHISGAYGGVSLHRMCNTSGGVSDVLSCGHVTKRELYERISAYRMGVMDAKEGA